MSEQDTKKLRDIHHRMKSKKVPTVKAAHAKLAEYQYQDSELTIQLRESTINELKALSWSLNNRSSNGNTYDAVVTHLIKSFVECRNRHTNFS